MHICKTSKFLLNSWCVFILDKNTVSVSNFPVPFNENVILLPLNRHFTVRFPLTFRAKRLTPPHQRLIRMHYCVQSASPECFSQTQITIDNALAIKRKSTSKRQTLCGRGAFPPFLFRKCFIRKCLITRDTNLRNFRSPLAAAAAVVNSAYRSSSGEKVVF